MPWGHSGHSNANMSIIRLESNPYSSGGAKSPVAHGHYKILESHWRVEVPPGAQGHFRVVVTYMARIHCGGLSLLQWFETSPVAWVTPATWNHWRLDILTLQFIISNIIIPFLPSTFPMYCFD
jgi:hypothetical protein